MFSMLPWWPTDEMWNLIGLVMILAVFGSYENGPLADIRLSLHLLLEP